MIAPDEPLDLSGYELDEPRAMSGRCLVLAAALIVAVLHQLFPEAI